MYMDSVSREYAITLRLRADDIAEEALDGIACRVEAVKSTCDPLVLEVPKRELDLRRIPY